jgi:F-type H+-transporting ATPase subunit gamma
MPSLKEVKNRISSVTSTQQITKAMKMVAAAKLRKSQERIVQLRPYSEKLSAILENVSATLTDASDNIYGIEREVNKVLVVVITSDRGLCGGFNTNAIKGALTLIDTKFKKQHSVGNVDILPIGNKSYEYFKKRGYTVVEGYKDLFTRLTFENVKTAAEYTMTSFIDGKYDAVYITYNEFKNVATQVVRTEQFLPTSKIVASQSATTLKEYIFEPNKVQILKELIPKSLKTTFYKAVLESNASEHGARMTAMDKATDNAKELLKELKLTYNRTRQAAITKEILEIVGGAEALSSGS